MRCALTRRLNFSMSSLMLSFNFRQSPCLIIMVKYSNQSSIDFETEGDGHVKNWNIAGLWNGFHLKLRVVYIGITYASVVDPKYSFVNYCQ